MTPRPTWPIYYVLSCRSLSERQQRQFHDEVRRTAAMDFIQSANATSILAHALPHITDSYSEHLAQISEYNVHLNIFERLWLAWYAYIGNDALATGIMSFVMHELVYFGRSLPWIIIDSIPAFNKYKIQGVCSCPDDCLTTIGVDKSLAKNPNLCRAMELCETRAPESFHG